jgi:hypothetical protein
VAARIAAWEGERPAGAAARIAAGEGARSAGAAGEGEPPAGAVAEGPAGAAGRVFAEPEEMPGARYEDLWGGDRAGGQQGRWAGPAADGLAGIRRARSWAPRVPGDRYLRVRYRANLAQLYCGGCATSLAAS